MTPAATQVEETCSIYSSVCAPIGRATSSSNSSAFWSVKFLPQMSQCQYSTLPSSMQVAPTAATWVISCSPIGKASSCLSPQSLHTRWRMPPIVQLDSLSMTHSLQSCSPVAARTVFSFVISVPAASSAKYLPHTSQYQYSILPSFSQVGSFASKCCRSCSCGSPHAAKAQSATNKIKIKIKAILFFIIPSL